MRILPLCILASAAWSHPGARDTQAGQTDQSTIDSVGQAAESSSCQESLSQLSACKVALRQTCSGCRMLRTTHKPRRRAARHPFSDSSRGELRRLHAELVDVRSRLMVCQSSHAESPMLAKGTAVPLSHVRQLTEDRGLEIKSSTNNSTSKRRMEGTTSSSSSSHEPHQHDALLFLFNALIIGTLIMHLTMTPLFENLQQTVTLFVLGMTYSLLQEGLGIKEDIGVLGQSYDMWMQIDPHLLLFALLPVLLTGDAMTIDTNIARRVASQCIYLASVGVLANAFLIAAFLWWYLPYDWSFTLSLTLGSIFAATDPVAVVSLLKELGASPQLTVQIQGESLLNDGTAIVLYTIAYDLVKGKTYDAEGVTNFMVKTALCAAGLGLVIGWFFVMWIKAASNRLESHSCMIQISLTLCCAYWSFIIAEGVLHISGVLCCVCAALVLADKMWPAIVSKEAMENVWHVFEYLGNTVIFFLAGALTGSIMTKIPLKDYLHLLMIYCVVMVIRIVFTVLSRPILTRLHPKKQPVSMAEAAVMSWGGLRGAVGLALAIQVKIERAGGKLEELDANRVLFYTGGVATLTLIVNATTCPMLVRWLGISQTPWAKRQIMQCINGQLRQISRSKQYHSTVRKILRNLLKEVQNKVEDAVAKSGRDMQRRDAARESVSRKMSVISSMSSGRSSMARKSLARKSAVSSYPDDDPYSSSNSSHQVCPPKGRMTIRDVFTQAQLDAAIATGEKLVSRYHDAKNILLTLPRSNLKVIDMPDIPFFDKELELLRLVAEHPVDPLLLRTVNEAFLCLVREQYWKAIDNGEFERTMHAEMLLSSVAAAFHGSSYCLDDFGYMLKEIEASLDRRMDWKARMSMAAARMSGGARMKSEMQKPRDEDAGAMIRQPSWQSELDSQQLDGWTACFRNNASGEVAGEVTARLKHWLNRASYADLEPLGEEINCLERILQSKAFLVGISAAIVINVTFIFVEEEVRTTDNEDHWIWLTVEWTFLAMFFIEFVLKFAAMRMYYFIDAANLFDFGLLVLGVASITLEMAALAGGAYADAGGQARILRLTRVFRVLRILRIFRLASMFSILKAKLSHLDYSQKIAESMQSFTCFTAFAKAHAASQLELIRFLGGAEECLASVEIARCLVESRTAVHQALALAVIEVARASPETIRAMNMMRECEHATAELVHFVMDTHHCGMLNAREAETFLRPLRLCMHEVLHLRQQSVMGFKSNPMMRKHKSQFGLEAFASVESLNDDDEEPRGSESFVTKLSLSLAVANPEHSVPSISEQEQQAPLFSARSRSDSENQITMLNSPIVVSGTASEQSSELKSISVLPCDEDRTLIIENEVDDLG